MFFGCGEIRVTKKMKIPYKVVYNPEMILFMTRCHSFSKSGKVLAKSGSKLIYRATEEYENRT